MSKIQEEILATYYEALVKVEEISPSTLARLKTILASENIKSHDLIAAFSKEAEDDDSD